MAVSVFSVSPLFPGTECIALARTALSPPAASLRLQGMPLSALKWLLNQVLLSSGEITPSPGASGPMVVLSEGPGGCGRRGCMAHQQLQKHCAGGGDSMLALSGHLQCWTDLWVIMACGS